MITKISKLYTGISKQDKFLVIAFAVLAVAGLALRGARINTGYQVMSDQGRDMLELFRWFRTGAAPYAGPSASVGSFHLGPLYYYLIAPWALLFNRSALGPTVFCLLADLAALVLGFWLLHRFASRKSAIIFLALGALSPLLINISRWEWNPNPLPLVSICFLYFFLEFARKRTNYWWIFGLGIACGVGIQLHYTFVSNLVSLAILVLIFCREQFLKPRFYLFFAAGLTLPLIPFIVGQVIHGYPDIHGLISYIKTGGIPSPQSRGLKAQVYGFSTFFDLKAYGIQVPRLLQATFYFIWPAALGANLYIAFQKNSRYCFLVRVLLVFYLSSTVQLYIKKVPLIFHYYMFFSISILLLLATALAYLFEQKVYWQAVAAVALTTLIMVELWGDWAQIPTLTQTNRAAGLQTAATLIKNDLNSGRPVSLYRSSPAAFTEAYEYRYALERQNISTESSPSAGAADYIIYEAPQVRADGVAPAGFELLTSVEGVGYINPGLPGRIIIYRRLHSPE